MRISDVQIFFPRVSPEVIDESSRFPGPNQTEYDAFNMFLCIGAFAKFDLNAPSWTDRIFRSRHVENQDGIDSREDFAWNFVQKKL